MDVAVGVLHFVLFALAMGVRHYAPAVHTKVVSYAPGAFERVLEVRKRQGWNVLPLGTVAGYTARPSCSDMGKVISLSVHGNTVRSYQVMDCSASKDLARHLRDNLTELDYKSAVREGVDGHTWGTVWGEWAGWR